MSIISIGPLMIRADIVVFLVCALAGYIVLRLRLRQLPEQPWMLDLYVNALLIGFVCWKFGMLVFDPIRTWQNPTSLLYMTGGIKGIWLGVTVGFIYMAWRLNRNRNFITIWTQSAWIAGLTFGLSWLLFQSLVGAEGGSAWHLILGIAFLLLLITAWMQFNKPLSEFLTLGLGRNKAVVVVMAALLAWVVVDFTLDRNASNQGHRLSSEEIAEGLKPGLRAPDFILQDQAGHDIRLSQYQGQTVLLNFWASWCPPCKVEMPYMQDFYEKYKQDDVVILSVNMTHLEKSPQDPQTFAMDHGLTFPIVYDEQGSATALYNVVAYPTTYAISPDGIISERFQGAIDEDRMIRAVRKATNHDG